MEKKIKNENMVTSTRAIGKRLCCMAPSNILTLKRPFVSFQEYVMVQRCWFYLCTVLNRGFSANNGNDKHPNFSIPIANVYSCLIAITLPFLSCDSGSGVMGGGWESSYTSGGYNPAELTPISLGSEPDKNMTNTTVQEKFVPHRCEMHDSVIF